MSDKKGTKKVSKKVLIVDYGSKSAENLAKMYEQHGVRSGIEYKIEIKKEKDLLILRF